MVLTLLGGPEAIRGAVFAAAKRAVELIDLRKHRGAHPRLGAVDVIPLVPIREITMDECVDLSRLIGADIADGLGVPVFFYERSATAARRANLADIRRGGFEALAARELVGDRAPDLGPPRVHPSAGAVVIGARGPLIAYNVNLDTQDTEIARAIARKIRSGEAGLVGVKSIAVWLAAQSRAQVSMNVTKPDETALRQVFEFVEAEARTLGVEGLESEIIGLVSRKYLAGTSPELLNAKTFKPTQILEYWL
jgi:glutamate formiminotransferase